MDRAKVFILAVTVLTLVLLSGIGCLIGLMPAPPQRQDSVPSVDIPGYMTYYDKSAIFSVSYPEGWEADRYEGRTFGWNTTAKEGLSRLQQGLPVQSHYTLFNAYKWVKYEIVASVYINLDGVFMGNPHYSIDEEMESRKRTHPDFTELSRTQTTVDGREATVWEWMGTFPEAHEQTPSYHFEQYIATDKAIWIVKCSGDSDNVTEWQNDFDTIARSLRISE